MNTVSPRRSFLMMIPTMLAAFLVACGGGGGGSGGGSGSGGGGTPAATYDVLHFFVSSPDGVHPYAGLVLDASGNLYGTTYDAGTNNAGTVFKITPAGVESVLYSFGGGSADGVNPKAGLVLDAGGNLYGTTYSSFSFTNGGVVDGNGAVFKITPAGVESVLHFFTNTPDGSKPQAGLVLDASGNIYGTTSYGGASHNGAVFEITSGGAESVLYSFAGGIADGANPMGSLVMDSSGNLYGTTEHGGASGHGTVFEITSGGAESLLYSFAGGPADGALPLAGLVLDASGNLYGTTETGGTSGYGTVFKITPGGAESVLHSFGSGGDGAYPYYSGLVLDASGNLYGTTYDGGSNGSYGTVFKITPGGAESVLHSFGSGTDGTSPYAGVVLDASGNIYGTTTSYNGSHGDGTVFEIVP